MILSRAQPPRRRVKQAIAPCDGAIGEEEDEEYESIHCYLFLTGSSLEWLSPAVRQSGSPLLGESMLDLASAPTGSGTAAQTSQAGGEADPMQKLLF